ncbi:MAG: hypothetical protein ABW199_12140 [Caulobacterales bacterium]
MSTEISVSGDHPALPGHFPGHPIVPGVVILQHLIDQAEAKQPGLSISGVKKLKFVRALGPGDNFTVECGEPKNGGLRIRAVSNGQVVAEGQLLLA